MLSAFSNIGCKIYVLIPRRIQIFKFYLFTRHHWIFFSKIVSHYMRDNPCLDLLICISWIKKINCTYWSELFTAKNYFYKDLEFTLIINAFFFNKQYMHFLNWVKDHSIDVFCKIKKYIKSTARSYVMRLEEIMNSDYER